MTPEQRIKGQEYCARVMEVIHDPQKYEQVMAEFKQWKKQEGLEI